MAQAPSQESIYPPTHESNKKKTRGEGLNEIGAPAERD
jgi:hypothetical protein